MSYEPPLDDPTALGQDDTCDECGENVCLCNGIDPLLDRMWGDD